jgi:phosphoglycerate kinase
VGGWILFTLNWPYYRVTIENLHAFTGMMERVLSLDDVRVEGRVVLLRIDINSPLDPSTGAFLDVTRIVEILPTMHRLSKSKVVILCHQSRPGKRDFTTTSGHARELGRLLGRPVKWVNDIYGDGALLAIDELKIGEILMLNNVRMDEEEISRNNDSFELLADSKMVQKLSGIADIFVNDAFACAHRNSPSMTGFTYALPCVAGELMKKEIDALQKALKNPVRPCIAVLGGIKIDDSIAVADNMLRKGTADEVWATGGVANLLLSLSGHYPGDPSMNFLEQELGDAWGPTVEIAKKLLLDFPDVIILPVDVAANVADNRVDMRVEDLPVEAPLFDLGVQSILKLSAAIRSAGTIILNGPAGVFELDNFAFGTIEMLNACAESSAYVVIGGGHTATLVGQRGLSQRMGHLSTGGGACLDFIAGRKMPAISSLTESAARFGIDIIEENQPQA